MDSLGLDPSSSCVMVHMISKAHILNRGGGCILVHCDLTGRDESPSGRNE